MSTRGFKEQKLVINFLPPKTYFWKSRVYNLQLVVRINCGTNPFLGIIKESNSVETLSPFSALTMTSIIVHNETPEKPN